MLVKYTDFSQSFNGENLVSKALGRNSEVVRAHNLSTVCSLVHRNQEISRSALAAATGLNRSTISDLVEELSNLGLVYEGAATVKDKVGRPSLVVSASNDIAAYSVHPEYDFLAVSAVAFSGRVLGEERVSLEPGSSPQVVVRETGRLINKLAKQLPPKTRIAGVGVAVPGQVQLDEGVVRLAPHLNWSELPLCSMLEAEIGLPVYIDNDASLGCMAEHIYGAARNFTDIVYMFGGSGIGGGVITGGVQLRGSMGYGGELGHVRISDDNANDYSGVSGTLESKVRREDIEKVLKLQDVDDAKLEKALLANRKPQVRELVERQLDSLAAGLANYINIFNPQIVVLAGFLSGLFWYDQERLLAGIRKGSLPASREGVIVRVGELGSNILIIGAAELPFAALSQNPNGHKLTKVGMKAKGL